MIGVPGKVALKEFLADGHILDGDQPAARFVLRNGVHEHRRISITQAIQRLRYVDEHGVSVYQKGYGVLHNRESTSKEHNESTQVSGGGVRTQRGCMRKRHDDDAHANDTGHGHRYVCRHADLRMARPAIHSRRRRLVPSPPRLPRSRPTPRSSSAWRSAPGMGTRARSSCRRTRPRSFHSSSARRQRRTLIAFGSTTLETSPIRRPTNFR